MLRTMSDAPHAEFIYVFLPGDRPELATDLSAWTAADERVSDEHYERLRVAADAGRIILAGRSQDGIGPALVIFRAESEDDARRFMEEDPFVAEGLFRASLHPFRAALVEGRATP
jgi:uncharacterized protein YciI